MSIETPLADKLKKYLALIEKLTLANPFDTGSETSLFNKNWEQSGKDVEHFLGLDDFNKKYGGDANILDIYKYENSPEAKEFHKAIGNALFSKELRKEKVALLQAREASIKESLHNYIWNLTLLVETGNPLQVSNELSKFWRVDKTSTDVFVKTPKFPDFFYAVEKPVTVGSLLHGANGSLPQPMVDSAGYVQAYATNNAQAYVTAAINNLKPLISDEESLLLMEQLQMLPFHQLPMMIYDSLILGILDAANTGIMKETARARTWQEHMGHQILDPEKAMPVIEMLLTRSSNGPTPVDIPNNLISLITNKLDAVKNSTSPYDSNFLLALKESLELRKFDTQKATQTTLTTLYSTIALIINQINKIFMATVVKEKEAKLYFGNIGYNNDRSKEQKEYLGESLAITNAPIVVLRGFSGEATGIKNLVYYIEAYVLNLDFSSKKREFEQLPPKPLGIPSNVHNYIAHKVRKSISVNGNSVSTIDKQDYIDAFMQIQDKSSASTIPGAQFGRTYWNEILQTAYQGDNNFVEGVFFVGLPPVFWDTAENSREIFIPDSAENLTDKISFNYITIDSKGQEVESNKEYKLYSAIGIYYDLLLIELPGGNLDIRPKEIDLNTERGRRKVEDRLNQVLSLYPLKSLNTVREELLKSLYNEQTATQQFIVAKCKAIVENLFATAENGFWSLDGGKTFASYNPWTLDDQAEVIKFRFTDQNTNSHAQTTGKRNAMQKYMNVLSSQNRIT